ncbi:MAG: S8 family peptidase [Alphaproteobacteria bacterium]|jgi:subtilisin family serine protease|nr:S8 family peptidase [Alphaproteobacteria bacterium]
MTILSRIALLSLGVSALPFAAFAQDDAGTPWVYGVAERHDAEADEGNVWYSGIDDEGQTLSARAKEPKQPKAPKPPKTPPAPTPPPPPPPPPPPVGNTTGAGILVAIVDTGIDLDHPEFAGRIAAGGACFGGSAACPGLAAQGDDNHGHGTHVAGIVAAAANGTGNTGVAPGASLLAVKVLDASGSGSYSAVASGISYAASKGARVINMSLGGSSASSTLLAPLQQAAPTAVIVAAAGNSGNAYAPGYPAAYATQAGVVGSMIIVGSVGSNNVISSFSQTPGSGGCVASGGKTTCFRDVFLVAPGQSIYSTYMGGGYATMSGTSMATPYVSGVAARVLGAAPYLTSKQVVSILFESATDLGAKGTDAVYGRGLVNLTKALAPLGTTSVATSGGTTAGYQGTGSTSTAGVSGVLAAGLRASQVAKNLVFFDAYGRDYQTDLSQSASSNAMSVAGFVTQGSGYWRSVEVAGNGFSVAGFVSDEAPNAVATAGFAEQAHTELNDVVVRAKLSDDASVIMGYHASPVGHLNQLDLAASEAYDGLFMSASALNSPFLSLTSDAQFMGAGVKVADDVTLTFGHAATAETGVEMYEDGVLTIDETLAQLTQDPGHLRSAENTVAAMSWRFAPWGVAGFNVAHTSEENSLLGTQEQGALALTADAATTSVGFGARMNLGDDWVASVSYTRGTTDASPVAGGLFKSFSSIESQAYGVALSKLGVFGDTDSIGFAVSRPLHITNGSAVFTASTGVTEEREILYSSEVINLASSTPETDYEVGYTARLDDNLTLQASAMYQQNVGGDANEDAVAGFVTLKGTW